MLLINGQKSLLSRFVVLRTTATTLQQLKLRRSLGALHHRIKNSKARSCSLTWPLASTSMSVKARRKITKSPEGFKPKTWWCDTFLHLSFLPDFLQLIIQPIISAQTGFWIGAWQPSGLNYWSLNQLRPIRHNEDAMRAGPARSNEVTLEPLSFPSLLPSFLAITSRQALPERSQ